MKKAYVLSTVSLLSFLMLFSFCESTNNQDISFNDDVMPIFMTHCINCHSSDASEGNLNLSSYETLTSGNNDHLEQLIVPGYPDQSLLYESVAYDEQTVLSARMPKGGPYLLATEIQIIEDWISQGAKDN